MNLLSGKGDPIVSRHAGGEMVGDISPVKSEIRRVFRACRIIAAKGMARGAFCVVRTGGTGRNRNRGRHQSAGGVYNETEISTNGIRRSRIIVEVLVFDHHLEVTRDNVPGMHTVRCKCD